MQKEIVNEIKELFGKYVNYILQQKLLKNVTFCEILNFNKHVKSVY